MSIRTNTQPVNTQMVWSVFNAALVELLKSIGAMSGLDRRYPVLAQEDVSKLRLSEELVPAPAIYDHVKFKREYKLSEKLLQCFGRFWIEHRTSGKAQLRMCQLFFLHEFLHIQQHVDSDTYIYSDNEHLTFQFIDYAADAFAVKVCFELEREDESPWSNVLADVLETHVFGGDVFSYLDDDRLSGQMEGSRLRRQMIWLVQYARAVVFKPEAKPEDFDIDRQIIVEVFRLGDKGKGENLCELDTVFPSDLESPTEIHITWGGIRLRHHITHEHYSKRLTDAVFRSDISGVVEAFRPLFNDHPELTGRSEVNPVSAQKIEDERRETKSEHVPRPNVFSGFYQPGWKVQGDVVQSTGNIVLHNKPEEETSNDPKKEDK